jgi:hypothetical protein
VTVTWPPARSQNLQEVVGSGGLRWRYLFNPSEDTTTYYSRDVLFSATARRLGAPATVELDETQAQFIRPFPDTLGPSYYASPWRQLTWIAGDDPNDRVCIPQAGGNGWKTLSASTPFAFALAGLDPGTPDVPADSVTLTRLDGTTGQQFSLTYGISGGVEYWSTTMPSSGANAPAFHTSNTQTSWRLRWTRAYDGTTRFLDVTFQVKVTNGTC